MEPRARIAWITVAPVKGLALVERDQVCLDEHGVTENRRLHLVDETGRMLNGKRIGTLFQVVPRLDLEASTLTLAFPDGAAVAGPLDAGEAVVTSFYGRPVPGRLVDGPFADALSAFAGRVVRLVLPDDVGAAVDRGAGGAVTLLGAASLDRLARASGVETVDPRRFRMLFGVDGVEPHEEDTWLGRDVTLGDAVVRPVGNVGRCVVTTRNPDSGEPDLDTLRALSTYRGVLETTEPLPFGISASVVVPGAVRVGDPVLVADPVAA